MLTQSQIDFIEEDRGRQEALDRQGKSMIITKEYLQQNPNHIFVFGDNILRVGHGGAALLRDERNTYGFITKKVPSNKDNSFFKVDEYKRIYELELNRLRKEIQSNTDKLFLISKLGAGLANRHQIFEKVIEPNLKKDLAQFKNVKFLW